MPSITYIYDDLGRLKAVADSARDSGAYIYDAVVNLLSIERKGSSVVSIIESTPKDTPVGTSVTIHKTGFSETPGENAVSFNGLPATLISATTIRIVAAVPSSAVSGVITVTTTTGSATSTIASTATAALEALAIAAFSPTIGVPGTAVTITGTRFDTTLSNNKVVFNHVLPTLSSATIATIETKVHLRTRSDHIAFSTTVVNPYAVVSFLILSVGTVRQVSSGGSE